jgi:ubiquinol-cytochrome c reductase cytochrome c1 subunit
MKKIQFYALCVSVLMSLSMPAMAGDSGHIKLPNLDWSFEGVTGTYDRAALQRGFKIYKNVCSTCHSMDYLSYRNLSDLGYDESQIKAIAAEYTVMDGPNDEGEMFERPAKPSDHFVNPYKNEKQARYANNGAYPPDMSLLAKARFGGADYIYGILTGYEKAPHGVDVPEGKYYNKYMAGHIIAMAPPLSDGIVAYDDKTPETLDQYAKDVSHFLMWAAEPKMEQRKRTGVMAMAYVAIFAGIMYATKKKIWKKVKDSYK